MTKMHKFYSHLGLCKRAGKLVGGEVAVENAVRKKTACLIVLAGDASNNTKKKFHNTANYYNIPIIEFGSKETLGKALGDEIRAVCAVTDHGFAQMLMKAETAEKNRNDNDGK